jgi:hypothetical protein
MPTLSGVLVKMLDLVIPSRSWPLLPVLVEPICEPLECNQILLGDALRLTQDQGALNANDDLGFQRFD